MRFLLTTVGTTGEVEPFVHLARGLSAEAYDVRVASHPMQAARFADFEFVGASADLDVPAINQVVDEARAQSEPIEQFRVLLERFFLIDAAGQLERYAAACEGVDYAVCHRFDYIGQAAVMAADIPFATFTLVPEVYVTHEAPPYPFPRLGRWLTKKAWNAVVRGAEPANVSVRRTLERIGAPTRDLGIAGADSPDLNMIAASVHLAEPRGDWPEHVCMTGPWVSPLVERDPEGSLAAFLQRHPRPVVFTFGSMGGAEEREETRTIIEEALALTGLPAVIQSGYSGLAGEARDDLLYIDYVNHDVLFAHARCVVHHAGAGTTVAACRAGVPSVPVPHMFDQYLWAGKLHQRGAAPQPIFRARLTAKKLAKNITRALEPKIVQGAAALGAHMRAERGVENAIAAIRRSLMRL